MIKLLTLALLLGFVLPGAAQTNLRDLSGQAHSVAEMAAKPGTEAVVLVVWCSQCGSCRGVEREIASFAAADPDKVRVVAVAPHPGDSPDRIKTFLKGQGIKLEVMRDANQAMVRALHIDRTTTTLVYDKKGKLRYMGPFTGSGEGFAKDAVAQVLAGEEVSMKTRPLKGCPIPLP